MGEKTNKIKRNKKKGKKVEKRGKKEEKRGKGEKGGKEQRKGKRPFHPTRGRNEANSFLWPQAMKIANAKDLNIDLLEFELLLNFSGKERKGKRDSHNG